MVKRFTVLVLAAFLTVQAPANAAMGAYPSSLTIVVHREATLYLTPPVECYQKCSPTWELQKDICYSRQIASARIRGWEKYGNWYRYPVTVSASYPGVCHMWFKAGSSEVKVLIEVRRNP